MDYNNSLISNEILSILGQGNLMLSELIKIKNDLITISSLIETTQSELTKFNTQLVDIQAKILHTQNYQNNLKYKQQLLNDQQLMIQNKQLKELEIQTSITKRSELERLKQQEIKKILYSIHDELMRIELNEDNVIRYFEILLLMKDINNNNVNPNELDNIADKEYASKTMTAINEKYKEYENILNDNEIEDIHLLESFFEGISNYISKIDSMEHKKLISQKQHISSYISDLEEENKSTKSLLNTVTKANNSSKKLFIYSGVATVLLVMLAILTDHSDLYISLTSLSLPFFIGGIIRYIGSHMKMEKLFINLENNLKEIQERKVHLNQFNSKIAINEDERKNIKKELVHKLYEGSDIIQRYPILKNKVLTRFEDLF